jgi:hypothetical protein
MAPSGEALLAAVVGLVLEAVAVPVVLVVSLPAAAEELLLA